MEKKIVTIDVGSEIVLASSIEKITRIDIENQALIYKDTPTCRHEFAFSSFTKYLAKYNEIKSINGIPVSEIEEMHIAGYNDKVTLKIGDVFYNSLNRYSVSENELYRILDFKNGRIIRNKSLDICIDKMEDYYYVNGKRYHRDDIIIPDHSGEANEMIQQQEFEEITPENWNEVWHRSKQDVTVSNCITTINKGGGNWIAELNYEQIKTKDFAEFLAFIQKRISLKPLPKFDFRQYLLDNGFRNQTSEYDFGSYGVAITLNSSGFRFKDRNDYYSQNKENADILIQMSKLAEGLK